MWKFEAENPSESPRTKISSLSHKEWYASTQFVAQHNIHSQHPLIPRVFLVYEELWADSCNI